MSDMSILHPQATRARGRSSGRFVGRDDVITNTSPHDPPQRVHSCWMSAGMVEHHHGSVLDVMKPPLDGDKPVFSKLGPDRPVISMSWNCCVVGNDLIHAKMSGRII